MHVWVALIAVSAKSTITVFSTTPVVLEINVVTVVDAQQSVQISNLSSSSDVPPFPAMYALDLGPSSTPCLCFGISPLLFLLRQSSLPL